MPWLASRRSTSASTASTEQRPARARCRRNRRRRPAPRARCGRSARCRVASAVDRRYTTSRTPASSCSWASARSPPITITAGLKMLTALASTSPSRRPAWRTAWSASRLPDRQSATTSRLPCTSRPLVRQLLGEGAAAGHRLDAAPVAAAAERVAGVGDLDVAEVAGGALGAAVDVAADDDPGADAGGDLDVEQVVDASQPAVAVLPQGHHVHVVVDEHRNVREALGEVRRARPRRPSRA